MHAWFAATMAITFTFSCLSLHRKSSRRKARHPPLAPSSPISTESSVETTPAQEPQAKLDASKKKEHRRPSSSSTSFSSSSSSGWESMTAAAAATHGPINGTCDHQQRRSTARIRKLSKSFSMRLPEKLSRIRSRKKEEKLDIKSADIDAIWTKAIILGEKCKVPNDDDDHEEMPVYDEKGNRRRNYRLRTPRSLSLSRSNSIAHGDELIPLPLPPPPGSSSTST